MIQSTEPFNFQIIDTKKDHVHYSYGNFSNFENRQSAQPDYQSKITHNENVVPLQIDKIPKYKNQLFEQSEPSIIASGKMQTKNYKNQESHMLPNYMKSAYSCKKTDHQEYKSQRLSNNQQFAVGNSEDFPDELKTPHGSKAKIHKFVSKNKDLGKDYQKLKSYFKQNEIKLQNDIFLQWKIKNLKSKLDKQNSYQFLLMQIKQDL